MTNFLEYRPYLDYKRKLEAVLEDYQTSDPDLHDHGHNGEVREESPSERLTSRGYVPSQAIQEAVNLTPMDTLAKFTEAKTSVASLIDKIIGNLKKDVTVSPNVNEYIKAREENDTDIIYRFEDFHSEHIEGSTAAETLPILFEFRDELESLGEFMGDYLFPNELVHSIDYLAEQVDRLLVEEEAQMKHLIEQDVNIELDEDILNEKNHIIYFLYERGSTINGFVSEVESVITVTPESIYYDSGQQIAHMAAQQTALRKEFSKLNKRRFHKHAQNTTDAAQRMKRLVNHEYKRTLLEMTTTLQAEKIESRDVLTSLYLVNPQSEHDAMNIFLQEIAEGIEETKEECDALVQDLYKITELENYQNIDYLTSLEGKNTCRHMNVIMTGLDNMSSDDRTIDREISKLFIQ